MSSQLKNLLGRDIVGGNSDYGMCPRDFAEFRNFPQFSLEHFPQWAIMGAVERKGSKRLKKGEFLQEESEWLHLKPAQRIQETTKLWQLYLALGGNLDPEPDPQSPFYFPKK